MDFLLECIGFPPDQPLEGLVRTIRAGGEPIPYRGPGGEHLRFPLSGGLEVRAEREREGAAWSVWPFFRAHHRLRMAVIEARPVPDSPFDRLLIGVANPPPPRPGGDPCAGGAFEVPGIALELEDDAFPLCAYVADARRLPPDLPPGHVLAVSVAGFALDVTHVGPDDGLEQGASFRRLGELDDPGGCMEVSLRVRSLKHVRNPLTGVDVEVIEAEAPGRPLPLFVSRWQLEEEGLEAPRPGWRIEGAFLFQGVIAGGLPSPALLARSFG